MAESIGQFQVLSELGKGAHSTIYHIRRHKDSKQFALKVVPIIKKDHNKFREQAEHEFRVAQILDHPNLIKIYALEYQRDWFFRVRKVHLLIEFVKGKTLDQSMKLTMPWLVQIFAKVAEGLAHMHRRGVFHADLKPNNIMLSSVGDVKIIDFGLAWIKGEPKERVQGTPNFIAPEQARCKPLTEQTDVYNFAASFYWALTGHRVPTLLTVEKSDRRVVKDQDYPSPRDLRPEISQVLSDIVMRCLRLRASDRYTDVGMVLMHIEDCYGAMRKK